jgi:TPR repeat protein
MYKNGWGVPQDYLQAYKWFIISASASAFYEGMPTLFAELEKDRDLAASKLTPAQIAEAQKLAREWKPVKRAMP